MKIQPSRTFMLASVGLLVLMLLGVALVAALFVGIYRDGAEYLGAILTTIQVLIPAIAAVSSVGAGSMALRDYGSRGLTSSQNAAVYAARMGPGS